MKHHDILLEEIGFCIFAADSVGEAVVGEAVVGEAIVGEAVVGEAVVGEAVVGEGVLLVSYVRKRVIGLFNREFNESEEFDEPGE